MRRFVCGAGGVAALLAVLAGSALPRCAHAWGAETHRYIASRYSQDLPGTLDGLRAYDSLVVLHVTDPDTRKATTPGEAPRHFIDIDAYPEFFTGTLSHSRSDLEAEYGAATVLANGIVPWAVVEVEGTLTQQLRAGQWEAAALTIADLCHYAADATQPLHCTENYDGQLTGNSGVHERYETEMMGLHIGDLATPGMPARPWPSVVDTMFRTVTDSWNDVAPLMAADNDAIDRASGQYDDEYYAALWQDVGDFTRARIDSAVVATASLVYTAWLAAGQPFVPGSSTPVVHMTSGLAVWPSPCRDVLSLHISGAGPLAVDVFDVRGAHVAHLVDGASGPATLTWRPRSSNHHLDAGLYFVRLSGPGWNVVRRVSLLN